MYHVFRKILHKFRANCTRFVEECVIIIFFFIPLALTNSLPFKLHITRETAYENTDYKKKTQQKQTRSEMEEQVS